MGQSKQQRQQAKAKRAQKRSTRSKSKVGHAPKPIPQTNILSLIPKYSRKTSFSTFSEVIKHSWGQTYHIARGRPTSDNQMRIASLGTGFLCGKQRFLTCAHCIVNNEVEEPMAKHQDGDVYFFVARNGTGNFHYSRIKLQENKNLFIYPDVDAAIIYLPDDFYTDGTKVYKHPDEYLELANTTADIGSDVGVIGYPFQKLEANPDHTGINTSGIVVRVDKGVINTSYQDANTRLQIYEFTMNFNPGNSGGPIIDPYTGKVVAWVKGFNSTAMEINDGKEKSKIFAHYSMGISTVNLSDIAETHNLAF